MDVDRSKIPEYFDEYYFSALTIWNRYKRFGFPFDGGWAEQPAHIIEVIEVFSKVVDSGS